MFQRADGRWCGAAYVTVADGTSRRLFVYGDNHREAPDKLAAKIADNVRGAAVVARTLRHRAVRLVAEQLELDEAAAARAAKSAVGI